MTEYRLRALDKRELRWPAFHLFTAVGIAALTYAFVTYASAK